MTERLALVDGHVLQPDLTVEEADVLVDQGAGTIVDVAPNLGDVADERLDASGGLVLPGLINAHGHMAMTLLRGYADGMPLDEWLAEAVGPVEAVLDPADVRAGVELALVESIRAGTTAIGDMYFHADEVAAAVEHAGVRARIGHAIITVGKSDDSAHEDLEESVRVADEFDGVAGDRIRTAVMPHALTTVGEQYLREAAEQAGALDVPLHFHANETEGEVEPIVNEYGKRPLEYANELGLLREDTWIAHAVHVDTTELDLLADRGTAVAHCPAANMKLASGVAPVQEMLDRGVEVAVGTDGAASNNDLDPFDEIRDATMVGKVATGDASAVAAADIVRAATVGGAKALGFDSGRIEVGANADLAVLDLRKPHLTPPHDLISHLAFAARGSDIRHTVADGRVLMRDREVIPFDETAVRERATERARAAIERAEQGR